MSEKLLIYLYVYIGSQKRNLRSSKTCKNFNLELNLKYFMWVLWEAFVRVLTNHLSLLKNNTYFVAKYKELIVKFIRKCSVWCVKKYYQFYPQICKQ